MKFGSRELLFLLVMLGLMFMAWYFVFRKADERLSQLTADTKQRTETLKNLRSAMSQVSDMNKQIEDLQKKIADFEKNLPRQSDSNHVVMQIDQQIRRSSRLNINTIRVQQPEKSSGYYELPIKIVMQGDFKSFYQFLLQSEAMPRITRINQLHMSKMNDAEGKMSIDMTLSVFFAPDAK